MGDQRAKPPDRLHRVAAAHEVVADVQAQPGAGPLQTLSDGVHLVRRLDPGRGMRVEGDAHAIRRGGGQLVQQPRQRVERLVRPMRGAGVNTPADGIPLGRAVERNDEHLAAGRPEPIQVTSCDRLRIRAQAVNIGGQGGIELGEAEPALAERIGQLSSLGKASPVLSPRVAEALERVEDLVGRSERREVGEIGVVPDDRHAADRRIGQAHRCCSSARPRSCSS